MRCVTSHAKKKYERNGYYVAITETYRMQYDMQI